MSTNKKLQELQNLAWRSLSGEFKEVVKNYYQYALKHYQISSFQRNVSNTLEHFFGTDNLTSDAEGEEMLTVSRKRVQEIYKTSKEIVNNEQFGTCQYSMHSQIMCVLENLFGSKCLPDEGTDCTPVEVGVAENATTSNVDSLDSNVESLEPKPAEPKFKEGDIVRYRYDRKLYIVEGKTGKYHYALRQYDCNITMRDVLGSDLKPYTEPKNKDLEFIRAESVKETRIADEETYLRNLSQETANCDKHSNNTLTDTQNAEIDHIVVKDEMVDNIIKDGFSKERRLNIAAMAMQGILSNIDLFKNVLETGMETLGGDGISFRAVAKSSFLFADALINEAEEEGSK